MMQEIMPKIKDKKLIIFGEIHGAKEIPELLSKFFCELAKKEDFNICLEIPDEFQEQINSYLANGDEDILRNIPFFSKEYCADGRNSLEYINLIKNIHKTNIRENRNIKIFCVFPSLAKNQEEVEIGIANNIIKSLGNKTFAITGNIHASKKEIEINNQKITPAGFLVYEKLKEKVYSIFLNPKKGEIFNNRLRKISYHEKDPFEINFDYVIRLEKVTPCSFL